MTEEGREDVRPEEEKRDLQQECEIKERQFTRSSLPGENVLHSVNLGGNSYSYRL